MTDIRGQDPGSHLWSRGEKRVEEGRCDTERRRRGSGGERKARGGGETGNGYMKEKVDLDEKTELRRKVYIGSRINKGRRENEES